MGKWKIIQPVAGQNYVRNPSAEGAASYAAAGGATVTRSTTCAAYGEYSFKIVPGGAGRGITLTCLALPATIWVQLLARDVDGTLTVSAGGAAATLVPYQNMGDDWVLYLAGLTTGGGTTMTVLNSDNETWYLDGIMAYAHSEEQLQTYIDGDMPGCRWIASRHNGGSTRLATTRAGGNILDLEDDLFTRVTFPTGGLTSVNNIVSPRPMRAGGSVDSTKILTSVFVLTAVLMSSGAADLNARQMGLADVVMPDRVPLDADGRPQPVRLQYWGGERVLEFAGSYDGGLDGVQLGDNMRIAPAFRGANDPFWSEVITRGGVIDTLETGTIRLVLRKLPNGTWDEMGPPSAVTAAPDDYIVYAVAQDDRYVYIGGIWANLDAQALLDDLAVYDRETGLWSELANPPPNGAVRAMVLDQAGNLWIGGTFTSVGGVACNYVARRTTAGVWSCPGSAGTGMDGPVYALAVGIDSIYAGGAFTTADGEACSNVARYYDGDWESLALGLDGIVYALAYTENLGRLYAGGAFTDYIQYYQPVPGWNALPTGSPDAEVWAIAAIRPNAVAYGGAFTAVGADDSDYVAFYFEDGLSYPLPNGPNNEVFALSYDPVQNYLYIGGNFTEVSGMAMGVGIVGMRVTLPFSYEDIPVDFAVDVPGCRAISAYSAEARRPADVVFGLQGVGTATWPGDATLTLESVAGGAESRPVLHLQRTGAGAAAVVYLENLTTGKKVLLNENFEDGEELYIDLVTLRMYSSFGGIVREISPAPGSQFASWTLLPGGNNLYVRCVRDVAVTITGTVRYQQKFHGFMAGDV